MTRKMHLHLLNHHHPLPLPLPLVLLHSHHLLLLSLLLLLLHLQVFLLFLELLHELRDQLRVLRRLALAGSDEAVEPVGRRKWVDRRELRALFVAEERRHVKCHRQAFGEPLDVLGRGPARGDRRRLATGRLALGRPLHWAFSVFSSSPPPRSRPRPMRRILWVHTHQRRSLC